jgi:hypothetical protein
VVSDSRFDRNSPPYDIDARTIRGNEQPTTLIDGCNRCLVQLLIVCVVF